MNTQHVPLVPEDIAHEVFSAFLNEPVCSITRAEFTLREHDPYFFATVYPELRKIPNVQSVPLESLYLWPTPALVAGARAVRDHACGTGVLFLYECLARAFVANKPVVATLPRYETFEAVAKVHIARKSIDLTLLAQRNETVANHAQLLADFYGVPLLSTTVNYLYGVLSLCRESPLMIEPN